MSIQIELEGPIHACRRWCKTLCKCYNGASCGWEAHVTVTVKLPQSVAELKAAMKETWGQAATNGRLWLMQDVTKTVSVESVNESCDDYKESFIDAWLLQPGSESKFVLEDKPVKTVAWVRECRGKWTGCKVKTDWKAGVGVYFVFNKDGTEYRMPPEPGDMQSRTRGTIATTDSSARSSGRSNAEDAMGWGGELVLSKQLPTPDGFENRTTRVPIPGCSGRYEMSPIVMHCGTNIAPTATVVIRNRQQWPQYRFAVPDPRTFALPPKEKVPQAPGSIVTDSDGTRDGDETAPPKSPSKQKQELIVLPPTENSLSEFWKSRIDSRAGRIRPDIERW